MRQNTLSFKTNNNGIMNMIQHEIDGKSNCEASGKR